MHVKRPPKNNGNHAKSEKLPASARTTLTKADPLRRKRGTYKKHTYR
jgi:hypothetical protein